MTKIAYNECYGGFAFSEKGMLRLAELKGVIIYKADPYVWKTLDDKRFSERSLPRTDPHLIQVIEELGESVSDEDSCIKIRELPSGTLYHIKEYDGAENVIAQDEYRWSVA